MSLCGMPVVIRNFNFSRSDKLDMDANDVMFSAECYLLLFVKSKRTTLIRESYCFGSFLCFSQFLPWLVQQSRPSHVELRRPVYEAWHVLLDMYLVSSDKLIDNTQKKRS